MPNIQVITSTRHGHQFWQRYTSYHFAANDALSYLAGAELPSALLHLPIAFVANGETFLPMAVLGLHPGKNLFIAQDGRWIGGYIPAAYRSYPFVMANTPENKPVLCIDEDSGLLSALPGEAFFADDGQPSPVIGTVLNFLNQISANRQTTERICALLQKHALIQPWPIKLKTGTAEQDSYFAERDR